MSYGLSASGKIGQARYDRVIRAYRHDLMRCEEVWT